MSRLVISQFAKLTNTPIDTIKHYDRIDLLKPAEVNENNGYRYYDTTQYYDLQLIKFLRSMEVPLAEIKDYMGGRDIESTLGLIEKSLKALDETIATCERHKKILSRKEYYMREAQMAIKQLDDISLNYLPERCYYSLGTIVTTKEEYDKAFLEMYSILDANNYLSVFSQDGFLIPRKEAEKAEETGNMIPITIIDNSEKDNYSTGVTGISEGYYLCGYYCGGVLKRMKKMKKIMDYAKDHGYSVCGNAIQISMADEDYVANEEEFVYQLQVPVII